jgi:hypothetical protein
MGRDRTRTTNQARKHVSVTTRSIARTFSPSFSSSSIPLLQWPACPNSVVFLESAAGWVKCEHFETQCLVTHSLILTRSSLDRRPASSAPTSHAKLTRVTMAARVNHSVSLGLGNANPWPQSLVFGASLSWPGSAMSLTVSRPIPPHPPAMFSTSLQVGIPRGCQPTCRSSSRLRVKGTRTWICSSRRRTAAVVLLVSYLYDPTPSPFYYYNNNNTNYYNNNNNTKLFNFFRLV